MRPRTWTLALCLASGAASAQSPDEADEDAPGDGPSIQRTGGGVETEFPIESLSRTPLPAGSLSGRVVGDFAEVYAGPGVAYVRRGRVYRDDAVDVRRRSENGEWLEIVAADLAGWVRAREVRLGATDETPAAAGGAGRDRKETNYAYDAQGRRRRLDGSLAGSGEGAAVTPEDTSTPSAVEEPPPVGDPTPAAWTVSASVGYARLGRTFDSNVDPPSALEHHAANPQGLALALRGEGAPLPWLGIAGTLELQTLAKAALPKDAARGLSNDLEVDVSGVSADLDVLPGFAFGDFRLAGLLGLRYWRLGYQESEPYTIFVSTAHTVLAAGANAEWRTGALELGLQGAWLVPIALSQSPADTGDPTSASGFEVGGAATYGLSPTWAAVLGLRLRRITTDFSGEAGQVDTAAGATPKTYDAARLVDEAMTVLVGARYTL